MVLKRIKIPHDILGAGSIVAQVLILSVAFTHVQVTKKRVLIILGKSKTCFATKLLKFGVALHECSRSK